MFTGIGVPKKNGHNIFDMMFHAILVPGASCTAECLAVSIAIINFRGRRESRIYRFGRDGTTNGSAGYSRRIPARDDIS